VVSSLAGSVGRNFRQIRVGWFALGCVACGRSELDGWSFAEASGVDSTTGTSTTGQLIDVGGTGGTGGATTGGAGLGGLANLVSTATGGSGGGTPVEFFLWASNRSEEVYLYWSLRFTEPVRFVIERDGVELVELPAAAHNYEDVSAVAGTWSAPTDLVASEGTRADAVDLAWQMPVPVLDAHRYQVFVESSDGNRYQSNTADGWRPAPGLVDYELSRDDGQSWQSVGLQTFASDTAAPLGSLTAPTEALPRVERDYVRLSVTAEPVFEPSTASYRVRAISTVAASPPSNAAEGYRAMGDRIEYQWERSGADSDADYAVLAGVTGAIWFAPAPIGQGRFYRAALSATGAVGFSEPVRAELEPYLALSAGAFQTCALRPDRLATCWGGGSYEGVPPETPFASIDAGPSGGCGIRDDGKRVCWGYSSWGAEVFPHEPSEQTFTAVSAGLMMSCGILAGGELTCWGDPGLTDVPAGTFKSVSVGGMHACAIDSDDRVHCWGYDGDGQASPDPSNDRFKQVSASWEAHSCGVRFDDKVVCWGRNDRGQAPTEATTDSFLSVSAGVGASCGLRSDHKLVCWGDESSGQAPVGVSSEEYSDVALGYHHTCALRPDGGVRCWGSSEHGQVPYVPHSETFASVSIGDYSDVSGHPHACGITTEGKLVCWGNNEMGQAPPGPSDATYTKVAAGWWHTCAIGADGKLSCWGYDPEGRAPPGPSTETYSEVSAESQSTCALGSDASITCFGAAAAAVAWGTEPKAALAVSVDRQACALDPEGELECWGWHDDSLGLAPVSEPGPFRALSTAATHTCALAEGGSLTCWGDLNPYDDLEPNWPNGRFSSIDAGEGTLCAIRDDQRLVCSTAEGGWFDTPSLDRFLSVSAGTRHFCAVRADHNLLCLGEFSGL